jgi:hypothetical protein
VVARNGKAETLRELGQLKEALEVYEQTILAHPGDVFARRYNQKSWMTGG